LRYLKFFTRYLAKKAYPQGVSGRLAAPLQGNFPINRQSVIDTVGKYQPFLLAAIRRHKRKSLIFPEHLPKAIRFKKQKM
jgi:hypothetical protein